MKNKLKIIDEKTFVIPKTDLAGANFVVIGNYTFSKSQIIEKLKSIVKTDRSFWLNSLELGKDPEIVAKYDALEEFLKLLED